jgi:hypothetical protein
MATLTLGEKEYDTERLPDEIQHLITVYSKWQEELAAQRVEMFKLEAALKSVSLEIEYRIKQIEPIVTAANS